MIGERRKIWAAAALAVVFVATTSAAHGIATMSAGNRAWPYIGLHGVMTLIMGSLCRRPTS